MTETPARKPRKRAVQQPVYAALDLGTNNCRLLIATRAGGHPAGLKVLDSYSRIVRLGEGVSSTGRLSEAAMARTLAALHQCKKKLTRFPEASTRFVATEACRRAVNGGDFIARVRDEVGLDLDIISGEEEANLAFKGCASLLKPDPRHAMVLDIGGGSTEFLWVQMTGGPRGNQPLLPYSTLDWFSLRYGVMNISEQFGGPSFSEIYFEEMVAYLQSKLEKFDRDNQIREIIARDSAQLLSTSGTVTTLAAIYMGLPRYERSKIDGITLGVDKLRSAIEAILQMRASERFHHPCIGSDRSDYILSGCAIFEAVVSLWPLKEITIADRGVREGIIMALLAQQAAGGKPEQRACAVPEPIVTT